MEGKGPKGVKDSLELKRHGGEAGETVKEVHGYRNWEDGGERREKGLPSASQQTKICVTRLSTNPNAVDSTCNLHRT